jgi:hypothetical protein
MKDGSPLTSSFDETPIVRRASIILNKIGSILNVHLSTAVCKLNLLPQPLRTRQQERA